MPLVPGSQLGPYEIGPLIGSGGMGEVYRAIDTRLDRTVAIKVLPAELASDPERRERFEREAKTISSLQHPHICTLHDVGHQDGIDFLVMEHLEGETLQDRLTKGALPLEQALRYAIEIANALDKAHRQGIVHRDLKPGNIMLTKAGAKLLDFGLAKLRGPADAAGGLSALPTQEANLTAEGSIVGTFQYMAPEQLEGGEADARTDIWAFGCVVYEMVTGTAAFSGESQASLIAAILKAEPIAITTLRPMSPRPLNRVLMKCLAKDPEDRWQAARDLGSGLVWVVEADLEASAVDVERVANAVPAVRPRLRWLVILAVASIIATGLAVWTRGRPAPPRVSRFAIATAPNLFADSLSQTPSVALSPDGQRLVYIGSDRHLHVRELDQLRADPLRGTEDGRNPFFSPDGQWVGFRTLDDQLKKVPVQGGPPVTLGPTTGLLGASWGADTIVFSESRPGGLFRIPAAGGDRESLTTLAAGEVNHVWPEILPGGEAVLFTAVKGGGSARSMQIDLLRLDTGERNMLVSGGSYPRYAPTGHLVYAIDGTLRAVRLDLASLTVTGDPVPVLEGVTTMGAGGAQVSLAMDGTLAYVPGGALQLGDVGGAQRTLVWVDREGNEEPLAAEPRSYLYPRLSPDGTRVALDVRDEDNDIWVWDFAAETLTRLTFASEGDQYPAWTHDAQRIAFSSRREGVANIFWQAADGTGLVERLTDSSDGLTPHAFTPDDKRLVFQLTHPDTGLDLGVLSLDLDRSSESLVATEFVERNPALSPDGRWLAYQSNASGQDEIYVRPFPDVDTGQWQVSPNGGVQPLWGPDGRELFYRLQGGDVVGVSVNTDPNFSVGTLEVLFERESALPVGRTYDIAPDGQRFLMLNDAPEVEAIAAETQLVIVLHWTEELKAQLPTP